METSIFERMRSARGALHTVSAPDNSTVLLVPASNNRGPLTLFGAAVQYQVGLTPDVTTDTCIIVPQYSATPVVLTLATHGDLVQQCFYVHAEGATQITWAESIFQGS